MQRRQKIILVGLGRVGREVLRQLKTLDIDYQITGLADSQGCVVGTPLTDKQIEAAVERKMMGKSLSDLAESKKLSHLHGFFSSDTLIVDTSAALNIDWGSALDKGCGLVFANKNAHSSVWLQASCLYTQDNIRYESTVGAGLPVINALRGQIRSGDRITRIEGVMSGTLGYICSQLERKMSYSQAVRKAFESGYTEPDPRDDLSGFDVLRKALILARTAGWKLERDHFKVVPMYDEKLLGSSVQDFLHNTTKIDQAYATQVGNAEMQEKVLRYLATINPTGGSIGLKAVNQKSQLGALQGTENYFAIYTHYYHETPLVIAGPGAGIEVTANGVLNDIIALLNS